MVLLARSSFFELAREQVTRRAERELISHDNAMPMPFRLNANAMPPCLPLPPSLPLFVGCAAAAAWETEIAQAFSSPTLS